MKCPVAIHVERQHNRQQSGAVNMPDAPFLLHTQTETGERKRQMLAALWQPVPWKMPCSIYSFLIQLSAAHTLQQQSSAAALWEERVLFLKNQVPSGATGWGHLLEQGHSDSLPSSSFHGAGPSTIFRRTLKRCQNIISLFQRRRKSQRM